MNRLKTESMDPDMEEHYKELLKEWKKDEDNIKDKLEEMEGMDEYWIGFGFHPLYIWCLIAW